MNNQTLYLIQSNFKQTESAFDKLNQIANAEDHVVLLGDAVLFCEHTLLKSFPNLYVLENDAEILPEALPDSIQKMDYSAFASLVLQFTRCIRLQ